MPSERARCCSITRSGGPASREPEAPGGHARFARRVHHIRMRIARAIEPVLRRAGRQFPAVQVSGARQTGKTSLLRRLFARASYPTLGLPAAERERVKEKRIVCRTKVACKLPEGARVVPSSEALKRHARP